MVTVYITISTVVHIVSRSCFCATRSVYLLLLTLQVMIPAAVGVCLSWFLVTVPVVTVFTRQTSCSSCWQTCGSKMELDAVYGHLPPLLCQDGHADLRSLNGCYFSLEQDRFWAGAGRILLGLLSHTDPGRPCQRQVNYLHASTWHISIVKIQSFRTEMFVVLLEWEESGSCSSLQPLGVWSQLGRLFWAS